MKPNTTHLLIIIILLAVVGFYYQHRQNQKNETLLRNELARVTSQLRSKNGKTGEDPYLAGPVKNTIIKSAKKIQSCYLDLLQTTPKVTAGRLQLDWQIDPQGKVFEVGVIRNELGNETFGECVVEKIRAIRFPAPPGSIARYVEHQFYFKDEAALAADRKKLKQGPLAQLPKKKQN